MAECINTKLVEFLGLVMGPNHEIAYFSGASLCASAVAHGYVSGIRPGSPLPPEARDLVDKEVYLWSDFQQILLGARQSGDIIQCTLHFIKDAGGVLRGVLLVNVNVSKYHQVYEELIGLSNIKGLTATLSLPSQPPQAQSSPSQPPQEVSRVDDRQMLTGTVDEITKAALREYLGEDLNGDEKLSFEDKFTIVSKLSERGIFSIKGSIAVVAQHLGCSEPSVYRYLSRVAKTGGDKNNKPNIIVF